MAYDAFISYSHAADGRLAPALQSALHRFARPWYRLRALNVFRDKTSLSATPALWPSIERALSTSAYFLLLASPDAARSIWVGREVKWWLEHRPADRLLVVLTAGDLIWDTRAGAFDRDLTTALPAILLAGFSEEPLWVDMRWAQSAEALSLHQQEFRGVVLDLAAPLHNRPKEELDGEDVRQHRRTRMIAFAAVLAIATAGLIAAWQAVIATQQRGIAQQQRAAAEEQRGIAEQQRDLATRRQAQAEEQRGIAVRNEQEANRQRQLAEQRYRQALGRQLAIQSERTRTERADQLPLSVLLAAEAVRNLPSIETDHALRASLALMPRMRWKVLHPTQNAVGIRFSPDGRRIATSDGVWAAASGEMIAAIRHEGRSTAFALSADGAKLARGGGQGSAGVWDAATGRALVGPLRTASPLTSLAFSPDGRLLATGGQDRVARVWDVLSGALVQSVEHLDADLSGPMTAIAFSPDGRVFAAARRDQIGLWDTTTWEPLSAAVKLEGGAVRSFAFSPDGARIVAATASRIQILEVAGRRLTGLPLNSDLAQPLSVVFSPNGEYVAATGSNASLVWQAATGRAVARTNQGGALAFSADGNRVAAGGADNTARVIELATGREIARMAHQGSVDAIAFSPDGAALVTASRDGYLRLWDASASAQAARIEGAPSRFIGAKLLGASADGPAWLWDPRGNQVTRLATAEPTRTLGFSADGSRAAAASGDTVVVWNLPEGMQAAQLEHTPAVDWEAVRLREEGERKRSYRAVRPEIERMQERGSIGLAAFSNDGRYLLTTRADEIARLWDVRSGKLLRQIPYARQIVATFSAAGVHLATATPGDAILVWDLRGGARVALSSTTADTRGLMLSRNARRLLTMGNEGAVLWDVRLAAVVANLPHAGEVAVSPDGRFLLTAEQNTARLWDFDAGRVIATVACQCRIRAVRFSSDGRHFAVAGDDGLVRVRSTEAAGMMVDLQHSGQLSDIAFSPRGALLAGADLEITLAETEGNLGQPRPTGQSTRLVRAWDLRAKRELFAAVGGEGPVVFSPDGRFLAGGERVWETKTGREVTRVEGQIVAFSPDLTYLVSRQEDWAYVWLWRPTDLVEAACDALRGIGLRQEWSDVMRSEPYPRTCARADRSGLRVMPPGAAAPTTP